MPRSSLFSPRLWLLAALLPLAAFGIRFASAADPAAPPEKSAGKIAPVKALLIVGGCCHDYDFQKRIIADGIEARAHIDFTVIHDGGSSTDAKIKLYEDPNWADQFDVIIHDECFANVKEQAWMDRVLAPHKAGKPAVLLHCAMHCYRSGTDEWFRFCGIHSTGHGPQLPIDIKHVDHDHEITKGAADWTTINEELYNNIQILTGKAIASGVQIVPPKAKKGETLPPDAKATETTSVVAWTNEYGPNKTKIFSTTIGHNTETVADARYLDLVTRGILWTTGHINENGKALPGYGK